MYFQELKSLKSYLSDSTGLKKHELKIMNSAIDSLDFWLITRSLRARKRLNPLQFADEAEISWNIAAQLFEMLEKQKVFSSFYEYWSEDGMECLIRTTDIDKIKSKDTLYNSYTDEYEDIDWNGNSFFDKFYKVQNFFPYAIPIVLDNEPPRM
jgi:hypothetical protein